MKYLKNPWWMSAAGCFLVSMVCFAAYLLHTPGKELAPVEFERLLASTEFGKTRLSPTPYAGFYQIEGTLKKAGKSEKFFITTHLDEAQVKLLLEQQGAKIDMPGQGIRGQWIN